jgi:hypothetical protein
MGPTPLDGCVAPIPWQYHGTDGLQMWLWQTPHFVAKIGIELAGFYWTVGDLVAAGGGRPRPLTDGRTSDFAAAERELREAIGKSYPAVLGYRSYAGPLATTFRIAGGQFLDFGNFEGQHCLVSVALANGTERGYSGYVRVVHYEVEVTLVNGGAVRIMPSHISKVMKGSGRSAAPLADQWTGAGRIYSGSVMRGCTGRPGFLPETIDHAGVGSCRIHEGDRDAAAAYA